MNTWLAYLWARIRGSLWFVPGLMSVGASVLVIVCARLDEVVAASGRSLNYLYAGDLESARLLLSTVAGSMITVAGVSFSVTMVALSLTSSQFGPHLLVNFMRDRGNQVVLGGFIGTFLFCLLALGTTTSAHGAPTQAPVSTSAALLLAAFCLVLLIYFIHHIASAMQADHVIEQVSAHMHRALNRVFPPTAEESQHETLPRDLQTRGARVCAPKTGYLQAVDEPGLVRLAERWEVRLRMFHRPGHFVIEGAPLLEVLGREDLAHDLVSSIHGGFIIGGHRTEEQDPEYGIHQLVEVAVRALSTGINDPFTAATCVDQLTGALCRIAPRPIRSSVREDSSGTPRLELDPLDFAGVLDAAFTQIRQSSASVVAVRIRLLEGLARIAAAATAPERRDAVAQQARLLMAERQDHLVGSDRADLERHFDAVQRALQTPPGRHTAHGR